MTEAWQAMAEYPWVTFWVGIVIMVAFSRPSVDASKTYNHKYYNNNWKKNETNPGTDKS